MVRQCTDRHSRVRCRRGDHSCHYLSRQTQAKKESTNPGPTLLSPSSGLRSIGLPCEPTHSMPCHALPSHQCQRASSTPACQSKLQHRVNQQPMHVLAISLQPLCAHTTCRLACLIASAVPHNQSMPFTCKGMPAQQGIRLNP